MSNDQRTTNMDQLSVRSYEPGDQEAVQRLYREGLLAGQIDPSDTGIDLEIVEQEYVEQSQTHFWVAEFSKRIVGMIGVAHDSEHTAQIRRLRVDKGLQNTPIAEKLVETALQHCKHHGYLKVVLDTRFERDAALGLFERFGFQHTRTKSVRSKDLLEFYLDLYRQPKEDAE